jgi:DNA (cytosine-5)-methyltransferase 1
MNYYNEFDPKAAAWLQQLINQNIIPNGHVDTRSITDVTASDLAGYTQCHFFAGIGGWSRALFLAGVPSTTPLWTGSCPCQPFSNAGKRRGTEDERHLWPTWKQLISQCKPSIVFGEQVASADGRNWLASVRSDLETLDYAVGAADLCAAGIGAPHIRQRLWFVGHPDNGRGGCLEAINARINSTRNREAESARRSASCSMAHPNHQGPQGRTGMPECSNQLTAGTGSLESGMGDTDNIRAGRDRGSVSCTLIGEDGQYIPKHADASGNDGNADEAHGFWRDADWLLCRDERWRSVEPIHVKMVDGVSSGMGRSGDYFISEEDRRTRMQALLDTFGEEEIQRQAGGQWSIQEESLLQQIMHGGMDGGADESRVREEQSQAVSKSSERIVRDMQPLGHKVVGASQGCGPDEQQPVELADIVRLLPSSLSLSELHGRRRDAEVLRVLLRAIREIRGVQHASESLEEAWASLGKDEKERVAMGFDAGAWRRVVPFPLATGTLARVTRLRGYGNAIVPQVAATFIRAALM